MYPARNSVQRSNISLHVSNYVNITKSSFTLQSAAMSSTIVVVLSARVRNSSVQEQCCASHLAKVFQVIIMNDGQDKTTI